MPHPNRRGRPSLPAALLLAALAPAPLLLPAPPAAAGPLVRRAQERRACQEFAGKLQQAAGNPAMAQQVYQQGVLQLVSRFGENPCGEIPVPTATSPATGATAPVAPASGSSPNSEQQQACQQFAAKLQASASSGGTAAAQQTYAMGIERLSGRFGANPCPTVQPPQ